MESNGVKPVAKTPPNTAIPMLNSKDAAKHLKSIAQVMIRSRVRGDGQTFKL